MARGSIRTGSYDNREGQKVYTTDVNVEDLSIIDFKDSVQRNEGFTDTANKTPYKAAQEPYRGTQAAVDFTPVEDDEDLPF